MEKLESRMAIGNIEAEAIKREIEAKVPYESIKRVVESMELAEYKPFEFNSQEHQLIFCQEDSGDPIEFHASTQLSGCDIYICPAVLKKGDDFLRAILAHELAEIAIYDILNQKNEGDRLLSIGQSHELALSYEKRFAESHLSGKRLKEYQRYCEELKLQAEERKKEEDGDLF